MSLVDIFVIFILFISLIFGFFRGFVKELLSVIAWVIAFFISYYLTSSVAVMLPFEVEFSIKYIISFVIIFVLVLIFSSIAIKFISSFVHSIGLGASNIILGGFFGILRGVILVYFLIFIIEKTSFAEDESWQNSNSVTLIKLLAEKTFPYLPQDWLNNVKYEEIST